MTTRQELYDRIRETSRNEVILEEMVRLGFWPSDESMPSNPATEIKRQGELERELRKLTYENRRLQNAEMVKRQQRKQRLAESKRKRLENKERRLREREQRAAAWQQKQQQDIVYLGEGVSAGLQNRECDAERLGRYRLQQLADIPDLANAMGMSVDRLRFLAFTRKTSRVHHYRRFAIRKKTGGLRHISAPMPKLKAAQHWILENILTPVEVHDAAHGFRGQRSIVSNAMPHVGAQVVINMDLKDFFPTVSYRRVKGVFRKLGFSEAVATVLGLICSESEVAEVELDGELYYVARGERHLPQGAPTSPAITNLICRGMDARLTAIAQKLGFTYTRYADDITFSSNDKDANVGRAIRQIKHVVKDEDFRVHPEKTRVFRRGRRMEVTGLTVNEKVNVSRADLRRFRATLHHIERDGPAGKTWGNAGNVIDAIIGYANFVAMVNPEKGAKLQKQVERIVQKHGTGEFAPSVKRPASTPVDPAPTASHASPPTEPPSEPPQPKSPETSEGPPPADSGDDDEAKPWWKLW